MEGHRDGGTESNIKEGQMGCRDEKKTRGEEGRKEGNGKEKEGWEGRRGRATEGEARKDLKIKNGKERNKRKGKGREW